MEKILLATGINNINKAISKFENFEICGIIDYKNEVEDGVIEFSPDIIIISEGLTGHESLIEIMLELKRQHPKLRIIYLAGEVELKNIEKVNRLGTLVLGGIYDIFHQKKINVPLLENMLSNPKNKEDMIYLTKYIKNEVIESESFIEFQDLEEAEDIEKTGYKNVILVSSIKPGTGKSFVSSNLATCIAKYGRKEDGTKLKVGLIEADLQTLSIGTLLGIEDSKFNLKTVMDKISEIIDEDGNLIDDKLQIDNVDKFIKTCFKPYHNVKNLEALVGSQFTMEEIENITPYHYIYLIESIVDYYDILVIDTNSSLAHTTTYPLLQLAHTCYYILNLDFNNVRNNSRYRETLEKLDVLHKIKYILNEDISEEEEKHEKLIFTPELLDDSMFKLEARIPMIDKTVFLNRLYDATPVILDSEQYTLKARYELSKIANQIVKIENLDYLKSELDKFESKNNEKRKRMFK